MQIILIVFFITFFIYFPIDLTGKIIMLVSAVLMDILVLFYFFKYGKSFDLLTGVARPLE